MRLIAPLAGIGPLGVPGVHWAFLGLAGIRRWRGFCRSRQDEVGNRFRFSVTRTGL